MTAQEQYDAAVTAYEDACIRFDVAETVAGVCKARRDSVKAFHAALDALDAGAVPSATSPI